MSGEHAPRPRLRRASLFIAAAGWLALLAPYVPALLLALLLACARA